MKYPHFAALAAFSVLASPILQAGVTFEFTYPADDIANNRYWYDPTYGAFARGLLKKTMDDIGEELDSEAVITCDVQSFAPGSNPGFTAGANMLSNKRIGNLLEGGPLAKITTGVDYNGPSLDARFAWNLAVVLRGVMGCLLTFPTPITHELGHVLYAVGGSSPAYTRFNSFFYDSLDRSWIANGAWTSTGLTAADNDANSYFLAQDGTRYQIQSVGNVSHIMGTFFNHPFNTDDRRILRTIGYKLVPRLNVAVGNGQNFLS